MLAFHLIQFRPFSFSFLEFCKFSKVFHNISVRDFVHQSLNQQPTVMTNKLGNPEIVFYFLSEKRHVGIIQESVTHSSPKSKCLNNHLFDFTRVDVSETFSADQLWFRILSGLFQCCSLPENLWTELIQSWTALIFSETALKLEIFRAKNQRWIRAVSALFSLKQSWTALIFSETALKNQKFRAKKNQLWISAVSALIFAEIELITTEAFWNSSYHSWSSPETTLNIPEICLPFLVLTGLLQFFSRET